jgi:hypothetical protein
MSNVNIERFTVLLDLTRKIAERYPAQDVHIIRSPRGKWIVELYPWNDELEPARDNYTGNIEDALEAFVTSPHK